MEWRRQTGTVVSLVLLASVVGHYVLHREFESRFHRLIVATNGDGRSGAGPLLLPSLGDESMPRILDVTERPRRLEPVLPALQIRDEVAAEESSKRSRPQPVPVPQDATPLEAAGAPTDESSDNPSAKPDDNAVRRVIEEELLGSSREERDIWYDELKSIPAGVVRDLLQVRKQLRSLPRALHKADAPIPSAPRIAFRATEVSTESAVPSRRQPLPDWTPSAAAIEQATSLARHNLINSITPGFKRIRWCLVDAYGAGFEESFDRDESDKDVAPDDAARSTRLPPMTVEGCRLATPLLDLTSGTLLKTGRPLDLAIDGDGFFVVSWNEKPTCTRCGALALDTQRRLCLSVADGSAVLQPAITIPDEAQEIQITARGEVLVLRKAGTDPESVGQLQLARFACPERLRPVGATLLVATEASGEANCGEPESGGRGAIQQGCLEQSNVELESELADIERLQSLLKSLPSYTRPVTAGGAGPESR